MAFSQKILEIEIENFLGKVNKARNHSIRYASGGNRKWTGEKMAYLQVMVENYCQKKWHSLSVTEKRWCKKVKKYFLRQGGAFDSPLIREMVMVVAIDMYLNYGQSRKIASTKAENWFFAEDRPGWYRQPWQPVTFDPVEAK